MERARQLVKESGYDGRPVTVVQITDIGFLTAAALVTRELMTAAGFNVVVLEKRPKGISNLTRAFGVHARTLELLDARGIADELVTTGQVIRELRLFGAIPFDIGTLPSRFPSPDGAQIAGQ